MIDKVDDWGQEGEFALAVAVRFGDREAAGGDYVVAPGYVFEGEVLVEESVEGRTYFILVDGVPVSNQPL